MKDIISGFSQFSRQEKIETICRKVLFGEAEDVQRFFTSFDHRDGNLQKIFDELSENTLANFYLPFSIAPNMMINGVTYFVPMVIEESSVVAAAAKGAKFWAERGGFHSRVLSTIKLGQVHFFWKGDFSRLQSFFEFIKPRLLESVAVVVANMQNRGGGIVGIELVRQEKEHYYAIKAKFETCNAMGANFINTTLELLAKNFEQKFQQSEFFSRDEKNLSVIMSILSNYNPECLVETYGECRLDDDKLKIFADKFIHAINISKMDPFRAATHNKGIFNGIDAVCLATGNDFRAVEAGAHTYACRDGVYRGLSDVKVEGNTFRFSLKMPLALGTVGGLTTVHPLVKIALKILGDPDAKQLMQIAASTGLAQNFAAVSSLVTTGIQKGHMLLHLSNLLRTMNASEAEEKEIIQYFKVEEKEVVSFQGVKKFLEQLRSQRSSR